MRKIVLALSALLLAVSISACKKAEQTVTTLEEKAEVKAVEVMDNATTEATQATEEVKEAVDNVTK